MTTTLLHLINRAERGVLLPEEAQQLRDGIKALDAARRSAGGMQRALHEARADAVVLSAVVRRVEQMATEWDERLPASISKAVAVESLRMAVGPARRALAGTADRT
jgi:hypothetical protein